MQPNFNLTEAQQMLALSYAADLLGPRKNPDGKGFTTLKPANNRENPLPNDNGTVYPYPVDPIWPAGWTPGFPVIDTLLFNVWHRSILQAAPANIPPIIANLKFGSNNVIVTYNESLDAYAVAFAGTENLTGALEDVAFVPVPAGPLDYSFYNSSATYIVNPDYYNQPTSSGQPAVVQPCMHFGFRVAVEEYTVKAANGSLHNLIEAFQALGKSSINLFVTGHSLGAAMAGVFSAWVQAGGLQAAGITTVNLKTYTFASPKWANDALANNFDNGLTKNNMIYRVVNNLDTVPQIPPTIEWLNDLNNPSMIKALLPLKPPAFLEDLANKLKEIFPNGYPNLNYVHVGNAYVVQGEFPVVYEGSTLPASLFPGSGNADAPADSLMQEWWQHWPFVYYNAMTNASATRASA